jgi:hypothetical protein
MTNSGASGDVSIVGFGGGVEKTFLDTDMHV